jgi:hypothetical protein
MARTKGAVSVDIDMKIIETLASIGATQREMATVFSCSVDTIERRLAEPANREILERGRSKFRVAIRRMQFKSAEEGNVTMQIWLGKQYLGQRDKAHYEVATDERKMTLEELLTVSDRLLTK